jgi:hypothetical protein
MVDSPEDLICLLVMTPSFLPPLDNSPIVPKEPEELARFTSCKDSIDKELQADSFSPPDVPSFSFPAQEKPPGSPTVTNDDCDANSGAGV